MNGDKIAWAQMESYCKNDTQLLHTIYEEFLPWIKNHPNYGTYHPSTDLQCAHCGSKNLQKRGTAKTQAGLFTLYQCNDCGKYGRSATNLLSKDERAAVLRQV